MLTQSDINTLKSALKCVTLHWTAGSWNQTFDDYHFCVTYDGKLAHLKQTRSLMSRGAHTLMRNTGNVGFSFCAMGDTHHMVEEHQIEVMAKTIAELCLAFDLNPTGTYDAPIFKQANGTLVSTGKTFKADVIADHCYYAERDGYGPSGTADRWDIGDPTGKIKFNGHIVDLLPTMKNKINWYYGKLKAGQIKKEYAFW